MDVLESRVDTRSAEFRERSAATEALVAELQDELGKVRRGGTGRERHAEQKKMFVRDRIDALLDPGSPFLELSPLAAHGMYDGEAPGAGLVTGIGRVSGREVMVVANETPPRPGGGSREPAAGRLPRRLGGRGPPPPGRRLSGPGPLRPHLLQPGADVGRTDSSGRGSHGDVHRRRRLRPGDVRRGGDRQGDGDHFPRRASAREGGDGRGGDRRRSRGRRRAHARLRSRRPLCRGRPSCAGDRAVDRREPRRLQDAAAGPAGAGRPSFRRPGDLRGPAPRRP